MYKKFKSFIENEQFFTIFLLILVAVASFLLGRASVLSGSYAVDSDMSRTEISIAPESFAPAAAVTAVSPVAAAIVEGVGEQAGEYVASKAGTKYHHSTCAGAKQIKEANKIYFDTPAAAEEAGYSRAANCDR